MQKNKRDKYDRMFFGFRDQLAPRYGYEEAKRLAYQFIKRLRKTKEAVEVFNLRCCDMDDKDDRLKYQKLQNAGERYVRSNLCLYRHIDDYVEILGRKFRIGFDIIWSYD